MMCIDHATSFTDSLILIKLLPLTMLFPGGSHLTIVTTQVVSAIEEAVLKKDVKLPSTAIIKSKLLVLVNALIENPSFEGQTKDALITKTAQITTPFLLPKEFLNEIVRKSGIVEWVVAELKSAENSKLVTSVVNKKSRKLVLEIPKLEGIDYV